MGLGGGSRTETAEACAFGPLRSVKCLGCASTILIEFISECRWWLVMMGNSGLVLDSGR